MKQLFLITFLAVAMSACAPALNIQTVRVGALAPAKPANCGAKLVDVDMAVAMNRYQQVGMLSVSGASQLSPEVEKRVLDEACGLGGELVVFNAGYESEMGGGFFQFMVFRTRPADADHTAPMDLLAQAMVKARDGQDAPPEKPIPAGAVVVVLDIEDGAGVLDPNANQSLTDAFSALLAEGGAFKIIPSANVRAQLKERAKDSYQANYDDATRVEMGKAAAAEKTLTTKLIRAGDRCALSAVLFDIRSQSSESGATVTGGCGMAELLSMLGPLSAKLKP